MTTIHEAVDDFILAKRAGKRAKTTLKWYADFLKPFVTEFEQCLLPDLTMRQVATFLAKQTGAEYTLLNRDKALRLFLAWAAKHYRVHNPMKSIPAPRLPEPEPKAIEADDLNRLIEVCRNPRDVAILIVLADCGLRASGLISVSIDDVDFAERTIRVREKRGRTRAVPFSLDTERVLTAWCKQRPVSAEQLFCTDEGGKLTYWGLREIVRRLSVRAGFTNERCNLNSLRHFAAREYLKQGGSLPALARILGHQSIDTTVRYYAIFGASYLAEVHDAHSPLRSLKKGDSI